MRLSADRETEWRVEGGKRIFRWQPKKCWCRCSSTRRRTNVSAVWSVQCQLNSNDDSTHTKNMAAIYLRLARAPCDNDGYARAEQSLKKIIRVYARWDCDCDCDCMRLSINLYIPRKKRERIRTRAKMNTRKRPNGERMRQECAIQRKVCSFVYGTVFTRKSLIDHIKLLFECAFSVRR